MDSGLHAERAFLGAVLADPDGQQHVLGYVRPEDFYRPWHGQVLAAMQRLDARGVLARPADVYDELKDDADVPRVLARDAVPLADLLGAGARSSHAPAYAGIVIGASLRRRLTVCGGRLRQVHRAGGSEQIDDLELENARLLVSEERPAIEAAGRRWESLPAALRQQLQVPARQDTVHAEAARRARRVSDELARLREDLWAEDSSRVATRLAAIARQLAENAAASANGQQRQAAQAARPAGAAAEAAGLAALRDLTAAPARIGEVADWLQPGHFARREHGEVYAVLAGLHQARMPVDPVTVSWEASRRGIDIDPKELEGGCGAFAAGSAAQVYRRAVLAQVERAGVDIQAAAADPCWPVGRVISGTASLLARLEADLDPQRCRAPRHQADPAAPPAPAARYHRAAEPGADACREAVR
jgi:hypothetical protein